MKSWRDAVEGLLRRRPEPRVQARDRRGGERMSTLLSATCHFGEAVLPAHIVDLCATGLRFHAEQPLPPHAAVEVRLDEPGSVGVAGRVLWARKARNGYSIGMRYDQRQEAWLAWMLATFGCRVTRGNRRRHIRFQCQLAVRVRGDADLPVEGHVLDVGLGGMRAVVMGIFRRDETVKVRLLNLELRGRILRWTAESTLHAYRVSILFDTLSPAQERGLLEVIASLSTQEFRP